MKKAIRILSLFLVLSFLITSMLACTSDKDKDVADPSVAPDETAAPEPVKEEPLVVNFLWMHSVTNLPEKDNFMHKWLLENKNIDLQLSSVVEKQEERMNMMLASGDIPDVVSVLTSESLNAIANKWGDAGLIVPLDDWLAKYPDLVRFGDAKYNQAIYTNKKDGKMYMIPINPASSKEAMVGAIGPFIREDWLKKVGMEAPKTTEELYAVLKAFKEQIPDVDGKKIIPATFNNYRQFLGYAWTTNWYTLSDDNQNASYYFMNPELEGYMVFMNKLIREGLLDPEVITQKDDQYQAKLSAGRVGFSIGIHTWMDEANKVLKAADPNARFIPAPPIRVEGKPLPVYQEYSPNMYSGIVVSKKFAENQRNMERLMEFLNWSASNEGAFILQNGPEGEFTVQNADGLWEQKPEVKAEIATANNTWAQKTGIPSYNVMMSLISPRNTARDFSPEMAIGQTVWNEAWSNWNQIFSLSGTGPVWNDKWGGMWGELPKWEAKAFFAKSEEETRKISQDMFKVFETNGGRDLVNERLKMVAEYTAKNPQ